MDSRFCKSQFLSTLSLRRATRGYTGGGFQQGISIHALLAESDPQTQRRWYKHRRNFYPRSPCGERRCDALGVPYWAHFYPRSPCGERHMFANLANSKVTFLSTLSLRRATKSAGTAQGHTKFLSTLSLRRATFWSQRNSGFRQFLSTLSLRRATRSPAGALHAPSDFYPRSPCGERLTVTVI